MRAVASIRTRTSESTDAWSASGVPATRCNRLIGTLSGWGFWFASCCNNPIRSRCDSPRPIIPPQHTVNPALRTDASVRSRSSYTRVVMIFP